MISCSHISLPLLLLNCLIFSSSVTGKNRDYIGAIRKLSPLLWNLINKGTFVRAENQFCGKLFPVVTENVFCFLGKTKSDPLIRNGFPQNQGKVSSFSFFSLRKVAVLNLDFPHSEKKTFSLSTLFP